jgi:methylthioribose-1-phosphate isomerase
MSSGISLEPEPTDYVYFADGKLQLLDQTLLPSQIHWLELDTPAEVAGAIRRLAVRGAPAIGIAGAYGVLLGAVSVGDDAGAIEEATRRAIQLIGESRPTARNLFWALERMEQALDAGPREPEAMLAALRKAADAAALEVIETDLALVRTGQEVIGDGARILTHCNSGPLAALRYGTAVGVFIEAHRSGKAIHVWVDETRPLLQGARLTTWELGRAGVPYTLICDNMAAQVMKEGRVDLVMTGADRIAANGDSANKIGTYGLAVLASAHGIPFYIAAPGSTVDLSCPAEPDIVIEERDPDEVRRCAGRSVAPEGAQVYNPAFDVTPANFLDGIVTDRGVLRPPYSESLKAFSAGE